MCIVYFLSCVFSQYNVFLSMTLLIKHWFINFKRDKKFGQKFYFECNYFSFQISFWTDSQVEKKLSFSVFHASWFLFPRFLCKGVGPIHFFWFLYEIEILYDVDFYREWDAMMSFIFCLSLCTILEYLKFQLNSFKNFL